MANALQLYRNAREEFRRKVPLNVRQSMIALDPLLYGAERVVRAVVPNDPQAAEGTQEVPTTPTETTATDPTDTTNQNQTPTYTAEELALARIKYERDLAALERQRDAQLLSYSDMLEGLGQQEVELGNQRDAGLQSNQGYFNRVSPDAYQSQTQVYNNKVLDAYNQGLGTLTKNKERIGQAKTNYLKDYDDTLWNLENQITTDTGAYTGNSEKGLDLSKYGVQNEAVGVNPMLFSTGSSALQAAGINAPYKAPTEQYDPWGFVAPQSTTSGQNPLTDPLESYLGR